MLLKVFVIPEKQLAIAATKTTTSNTATASTADATKESTSKATMTDTSYQSDDLSITLTTKRVEDTTVYVVDKNGDFSIVNEQTTPAKNLTNAEQILSFGPALVEKGEVVVNQSSEVTQSMTSNPRTAIGQISENHYVIIVSEGRTESSEGLSLYELAQEMQTVGATIAYNLDGGGASTLLYFNGKVVNQTVGGSQNSSERELSDILYFK